MNPLLTSIIGGLVRLAIGPVMLWLVHHEIITEDQQTELVALVATFIIGGLWVVWNKVKEHRLLNTAVALQPGPVTVEDVKALIKRGQFAAAGTGSGEVPIVKGTGDGGPPTLPVILLVAAIGGLTLTNCGSGLKIPPTSSIPAAVVVVDADVKAFTIYSLGLVRLVGEIGDDASGVELTLFRQGVIPAPAHARIDDAFKAFAREGRSLAADLRDGTVKAWAAFRARLEPLSRSLQGVIDAVRQTGPSVWQRLGNGLLAGVSLLAAGIAAPAQ